MQNNYTEKDSSFSFVLALVIPNVLAFIVLIIAGFFTDITKITNTVFYKIMATTLSQISFLLIFLFIIKRKNLNIKNSLNLNKINIKQILILILISFVCLFLISPIINVFDNVLVSFGVESSTLPININKPINFIYLVLTMGVFAPIAEEILFRGVIFEGLRGKGNKFAILISSLMFMLIHLSLHQTIYQFILGIILAIVTLYTGSIFSSIFIHFINNTFVLLINYISPHFFDYSFLSSNYIILAVVLFILALVILFVLLRKLKILNNKQKITQFGSFIDYQNKTTNNQEQNKSSIQNKYVKYSLIIGVALWILTVLMSL